MNGHAIITGASSGIGAALARELAGRGLAVGLIARREAPLQALVEQVRAAGGEAAWATADVTRCHEIRAAVEQLQARNGPCTLLVANAGISARTPAYRLDVEQWRSILRVNVEGALNTVDAVLPGMLERGAGHLVVLSSLSAYRGLPRVGPYCASKAAVSALWESMRLDLAPRGLRFTTVHPGYIATPLTEGVKGLMFLMSAERAARIIAQGVLAGRSEVNFPWQMVLLLGLLRRLPNFLYDRLIRRFA